MFYGVRVIGEFPYFSISHTTTDAIQKICMAPVVEKSYNHWFHTKNLYGSHTTTGAVQFFCMEPVVV